MERQIKHPEDSSVRDLLNKIKLTEAMTTPVITVREDAKLYEVADKIWKNGIRHMPVVDKDDKLVGLVTERSLYKTQSPRWREDGTWYYDPEVLDNFILKHVMIQNPFAMGPDNTLAEAILKMVSSKYGSILVVDKDRKVCGIVSYVDILKLAALIIQEK